MISNSHLVLSLIILLVFNACLSHQEVKPWQKGILAEETMQLGGGDSMLKKINEHVFTSKEGSFGGNGIGGGGCGCN